MRPDVLDGAFLELAERCAQLSSKVYDKVSAIGDAFVRDNFWVYPPDATKDTYTNAALISREYDKGRCIVALAGTNFGNWEDKIQVFNLAYREVQGCNVREGWAEAFLGTESANIPIEGHYAEQLRQRIQYCIDDGLKLVFTGHSQGGALALVGHLAYNDRSPLSITFAAPPTFVSGIFDTESDPCPKVKNDRIYWFINTEHDELALNYDLVPFVGEAADQIIPLGLLAVRIIVRIIFKIDLSALGLTVRELRRLVGKHKGPVAVFPPFTTNPEESDGTVNIKVYPNQVEVGYPLLHMFDYFDVGLGEKLMSIHDMSTYKQKISDMRNNTLKTNGFKLNAQCNYDRECSSGKCKAPDKKTCLRKLKVNTYDCYPDEDCESGRCNGSIIGYKVCEQKLELGGDCLVDTDCEAIHYCPFSTSCSEKLDNGVTCALDNCCKSGRCDGITCSPLITDTKTDCDEDSDCATGRCVDIPWSIDELCLDKIWDGSDEKCERNADCVDGSFCDTIGASATYRCVKKLGLGKECIDHPDCESGRCDFPASKVCVV